MSRHHRIRTKQPDAPFEVRLPVPNPAEAHALAMTHAHLAHAAHLNELLASTQGDKDLKRRLERDIETLLDQADAQWRSFLASSCVTVAEYDAMDAMGPPQMVNIAEDGLPVAIWEAVTPRDPAHWPPGLTLAVARNETTFVPTVPFRQVKLASLPTDVSIVRITDPRHGAMSALDEVFRVLGHDLDVHMRDVSAGVAWRRLAHLAAFYTKAAKLSREALGDDEFRDWDHRLRADTPVDQMARVIADGALTSRAQHVAALQMVARLIGQTMTVSQNAAVEGDETDWMASALTALDMARTRVEVAMEGYNLALMALAGVVGEGASAMAITRPEPHGFPVLAIVPKGTPVASVESRARGGMEPALEAPPTLSRIGESTPSTEGGRATRRTRKPPASPPTA